MSHLTACGLVCVPGCVPSSDSGCLKHVKTGITKGHVAACGAACLGVQAGAGIGFAAGVCSLAQGAIAMGVTAPAFGAAVCTVQRQCRNSCQHGNVGHEAGTVGHLPVRRHSKQLRQILAALQTKIVLLALLSPESDY